MRKKAIQVALLMACATPAVGDSQEDFKDAGMQLGFAALCRATYGDHELFEEAFSYFRKTARDTNQDISDEELNEAKLELYEMEAESGENPILRSICEKLRNELLPND